MEKWKLVILFCILAFLSGAAYEACCVMWVYHSTNSKAVLSGFFAMLAATVQLIGIGSAIHDIKTAPFFIVGYGFGSYLAVKLSKRKEK